MSSRRRIIAMRGYDFREGQEILHSKLASRPEQAVDKDTELMEDGEASAGIMR